MGRAWRDLLAIVLIRLARHGLAVALVVLLAPAALVGGAAVGLGLRRLVRRGRLRRTLRLLLRALLLLALGGLLLRLLLRLFF